MPTSRTARIAMLAAAGVAFVSPSASDGQRLPPTSRRPSRNGDPVADWKRRRREKALEQLRRNSWA